MNVEEMRRAVAERAASLVDPGMTVGLGTGRTAALVVRAIAARTLAITGVATSEATAKLAGELGIPLATLDTVRRLDLCIDGADEFDPRLDLIKGLGGALLREKLVAQAAARLVIIVDEEKRVTRLGERSPLPVEVVPFGWTHTRDRLTALGVIPSLRVRDNQPVLTDGGNLLLDCRLALSIDARLLGAEIKALTGVVDHGLFLGMADTVLVGTPSGVEELRRDR
ncbi:MAG: ribose-5-phosphate isomerase RpiA [Myxococcales bacterium]|nr:ribose-5-phosphate isomerase RpiA [Myxococcales bacterium]